MTAFNKMFLVLSSLSSVSMYTVWLLTSHGMNLITESQLKLWFTISVIFAGFISKIIVAETIRQQKTYKSVRFKPYNYYTMSVHGGLFVTMLLGDLMLWGMYLLGFAILILMYFTIISEDDRATLKAIEDAEKEEKKTAKLAAVIERARTEVQAKFKAEEEREKKEKEQSA